VCGTTLVTKFFHESAPHTLCALDVDTGELRWRREGYGWQPLVDTKSRTVSVGSQRGMERWSLDDGRTVSVSPARYDGCACLWPTGAGTLAVWMDPHGLVVTPLDDAARVLARWPDGTHALPLPDGDLIVAERRGALVRLRAESFVP
jgi:hypothetical protein